MAIQRTRKEKESPRYNFLYSWTPSEPHVKREKKLGTSTEKLEADVSKRANILAKDPQARNLKKDIIRSIIVISFILCLEVVVYLAWIKFNLS